MGSSVESFIMKTLCIISILSSSSLAQLKFGSSGNSDDKTDTKKKDIDTKFFTGNEALDGGIVGLGAGLLGGALLGGSGGGCNCGRRRRQAPGEDQPGTRFFGLENLLGGGNNNCCNCPPAYNNNNNGYNSC